MDVTAESLHERYDAMNTEALADLYHAGGMTDLAVSVLKDVITSRGLDWAEFITPSPTEPASGSLSNWELWKSQSEPRKDCELRKSQSERRRDWSLWRAAYDAIVFQEDKEKVRTFVGRGSNVLVPLVITLAGVAGIVAALYNDFTAAVIAVFLLCVGIAFFFFSSRKKLVLVITLSLLVLLLFVPVAIISFKPWATPEVLTGDSVSDDVLEHLRTHSILEPSEELIAYYDNTLYDDGTEASILTTRRIIYYCDNEICRGDGRFGDRNLRRTTAISLSDITDIQHRIGTMINDGFPGDIIEIQSAQGEQLTILIDMWHDGPSFLDLFLVERVRESREK